MYHMQNASNALGLVALPSPSHNIVCSQSNGRRRPFLIHPYIGNSLHAWPSLHASNNGQVKTLSKHSHIRKMRADRADDYILTSQMRPVCVQRATNNQTHPTHQGAEDDDKGGENAPQTPPAIPKCSECVGRNKFCAIACGGSEQCNL